MTHIEVRVGTDHNISVALRTPQDEPVTSFLPGDTPYAEVSSGGNLPVLWSPAASWMNSGGGFDPDDEGDPSTGKYVIHLTAADTGNYDAGKYVIRNGVITADGRKLAAPDLDLTLLPSPSTVAVTPKADVTYQRLLADAPWLADDKTGPQNFAGYLGERGQARSWFIENVRMWYSSWRERGRLSEGWSYSSPTVAEMKEYLENGDYEITTRILSIQSAKAISIICSNALTPGGKAQENQYQDVAMQMTNRANSLFAGLEIHVANENDGVDISFDDTILTNNKSRWY